jgi:hypothetical protein
MRVARLHTVTVIVACACSPHRVSSAELVTALEGTGLHVEKRADVEAKPEWVGAEVGVDLVLDYEETYRGVRFASANFARGYCQEGQAGVPVGCWCLEPVGHSPKQDVWNKVNLLRTR